MHSEGEEEGTGDVDVAVEDEEVGVVQGEDKSGGGKKNVLDGLGRGGLGKRSRAFLALKVGVGHDKVSTGGCFYNNEEVLHFTMLIPTR